MDIEKVSIESEGQARGRELGIFSKEALFNFEGFCKSRNLEKGIRKQKKNGKSKP